MKLSLPVQNTIRQFNQKFPMPVGETNLQNWIHKLCEQLAYSYPMDHWSHKGRPHSKDAIAMYPLCWDIIIGAGTQNPVLDLNADSQDMTGQVIEEVTPINWLGDTPLPPPITNLEERVADLERRVTDIEHALQDAAAAFMRV